jgi:hypothetical protein
MYDMQAFFQKSLYIVFSYYIKIYKEGDDWPKYFFDFLLISFFSSYLVYFFL